MTPSARLLRQTCRRQSLARSRYTRRCQILVAAPAPAGNPLAGWRSILLNRDALEVIIRAFGID